jgi:hypothetical protein
MNILKMWIGPRWNKNYNYTDVSDIIYPEVFTKITDIEAPLVLRNIVDLNRWLLLADKGGIYVDIDTKIFKDLSPLYKDNIARLPRHNKSEFVDNFLITSPASIARDIADSFINSDCTDMLDYINILVENNDPRIEYIEEDEYKDMLVHYRNGTWVPNDRDQSWILKEYNEQTI